MEPVHFDVEGTEGVPHVAVLQTHVASGIVRFIEKLVRRSPVTVSGCRNCTTEQQ